MVNVILVGLGAMGSGMSKMILQKEGINIVAAVDSNKDKAGQDIGLLLGGDKSYGVKVRSDFEKTMEEVPADIVLLAIDSFVKNVYPYIKKIVSCKKNCITIAEEMAYGKICEKELWESIDYLCKKNGVSVLGTGVNPGFVLDTLVAVLTAPCIKIDKIVARRINDLSPFGPTVMKTQGVGSTVIDFNEGINNGSIVGHIGFMQSISLVAKTLGIEIDSIVEDRKPIISNVYRETPHVKVEPNMVAGCNHVAYGMKNGEKVIVMEHPQQIHPDLENVSTGDFIEIYGVPNIKMSITPEVPGGIGTMALAVNMIPQVIAATPGVKTMMDLPLPHGIENSFKSQVEDLKKSFGGK